jgi:uncharacterized membrane protein
MIRLLIAYAATALVFGAMDFGWLSLTVQSLYRAELGPMMSDKVRLLPAFLFYLAYVLGVIIFVVEPGLGGRSLTWVLIHGALLGVLAYATYDLTNYATLSQWSLKVTVLDLCWGAFATGVAATAGTWITRALVRN